MYLIYYDFFINIKMSSATQVEYSRNDLILIGVSTGGFMLGLAGMFYFGWTKGYFKFLKYAHYVSCLFLVVSGVLTWAAMVWMINPKEFKVEKKQWVSLVVSILISILYWARYAYTIADNEGDGDNNNLTWDEDDDL